MARVGFLFFWMIITQFFVGGNLLYAYSDSPSEIKEFYRQASTLYSEGDYRGAIDKANDVIFLANSTKDWYWVGRGEYLKGYIYQHAKQDFISALTAYYKAKTAYETCDSTHKALDATISVAAIFGRSGLYEKSHAYYWEAHQTVQSVPQYGYHDMLYKGLANQFKYLGDTAQALYYYKHALKYQQSPRERQGVLLNIGFTYLELGKTEEAKSYTRKGLEMGFLGNVEGYGMLLNNYGYLLRQENIDSAEYYLQKAIAVYNEHDASYRSLLCLQNLAEISLSKGNRAEAMGLLYEALAVYKFGYQINFDPVFEKLIPLLEQENDYQEIVRIQRLQHEWAKEQAIFLTGVNNTETRVNMILAEKELIAQNKEPAVANNQWINLFWGIGFLLALFTIGHYIRQAQIQKNKVNKMRRDAAAAYMSAYEYLNKK